MTQKLSGRVALVTGGGGRIGAETCLLLAAHGASIVVADIDGQAADRVVKDIVDQGGSARATVVDMAEDAQVANCVEEAMKAYGRLDILDNNAAPMHLAREDHALTDMAIDTWDQIMATVLRGPMLFTKHALPHLLESDSGVIVFISAMMALHGDWSLPAYSAAKAALNSLTRSVATQYGHRGLRCNAVCPGFIPSDRVTEQTRERMLRHQLLPSYGRRSDVANAVLFLAADDSAFITGQMLVVDGGYTAHGADYAEANPAG